MTIDEMVKSAEVAMAAADDLLARKHDRLTGPGRKAVRNQKFAVENSAISIRRAEEPEDWAEDILLQTQWLREEMARHDPLVKFQEEMF